MLLTFLFIAELKKETTNCLERFVWINENRNIPQVGELRKDKVLLLYVKAKIFHQREWRAADGSPIESNHRPRPGFQGLVMQFRTVPSACHLLGPVLSILF